MSTLTTIQSGDLISNSRADINNNFDALNTDKMETSVLDTDTTLAANSDAKIPSQKAVKAYVDAGGNVNASTTAKGIVEIATSAEIDAGTDIGGTGAQLVVTASALKGSLAPIVRTYLNAGSPHTWTKPTGLKYVVVEVQAGGGGSGGVSDNDDGSGGGAGGYGRKLIGVSSLGSTETVTVGAAGTAGGANPTTNGGNGGSSSFGSHVVANGGNGSVKDGGAAGTGGTCTGGDINITGQAGGNGGSNSGTSGGPDSGFGGSSILGLGGQYENNKSPTGYGGGAGGPKTNNSTDVAGAAGGPGIVIVTEYYV